LGENMLANKLLVLAVCGMGIIEPVMAEDLPAGAQYSLVARRFSNGQYQAEVWRRDDKGKDEFVGTNYKPHVSAATAMDDACLLLRKYFDPSFSCSQMPADQKTAEKTTETGVPVADLQPVTANKKAGDGPVAATTKTRSDAVGGSAAGGKVASAPEIAQAKREISPLLLQAYEKITQQDALIAALREEVARLKGRKSGPQSAGPTASNASPSQWGKDFWTNQTRFSGGGSGGGGGTE
jgi:hypothetical protein